MTEFTPRCWIDWKVPLNDDGEEIGSATNGTENYERYLHWLADYLHTEEFPIPDRQREIIQQFQQSGGADSAVFNIASSLGYGLYALDGIESEIEGGISWEDFHNNEKEYWEELSPEEKEGLTEEEVVLSRAKFERICNEVEEKKVVPAHIRHADVPFRAVLAAFFHDIADHDERYRILDRFYREFNDCASN